MLQLLFYNSKNKIDIDECEVNNGGCHSNATCENTIGSFSCACKKGYSGDGINCVTMDENNQAAIGIGVGVAFGLLALILLILLVIFLIKRNV